MKKVQFLFSLAILLSLASSWCAACVPEAEVVAAPVPTWTPDPLWVELMDNVGICVLGSYTFKMTLPTGPRVTQITLFFSAGDTVYTFPVEESVWLPYEGFREFMGVSNEVEIDQFDRVLMSIEIDGQAINLSLPLERCPSLDIPESLAEARALKPWPLFFLNKYPPVNSTIVN